MDFYKLKLKLSCFPGAGISSLQKLMEVRVKKLKREASPEFHVNKVFKKYPLYSQIFDGFEQKPVFN
ncbi:TPA: hypothetical protein HA338_11420 [Methanosarcina acetivorans]|uniref:Uncharacterized protein n=1 Tax=Methanosarcina acetivorans TaxID=2214 RepID=A0A832SA51_9EURY|nr:hypothetical protein [Methanosarcina acetivorans]HIH94598.1 hypothetical protein [Methanosarcina acetivorans]